MSIEPRKETLKSRNLVVQQAQRECDSELGGKNCCYHRADYDEELGFFTFYCWWNKISSKLTISLHIDLCLQDILLPYKNSKMQYLFRPEDHSTLFFVYWHQEIFCWKTKFFSRKDWDSRLDLRIGNILLLNIFVSFYLFVCFSSCFVGECGQIFAT